ncbi:PE family protein [Mycobacterium attenuatum]|uniref:PE family protein n=1 Tax=Mycobacterium attenuatum TaxID=2341086 RepID=UPI000F03A904|nr:PE family protein [Mycobacterium attenuatum]VBA58327.1 Triacylglycerol lipase [Mycobacterium attenuatum]VBA61239.1 Triacylglycerol lipase [Mycobacterium attenuatum]
MTFVVTQPETLAAAAGNLQEIGSAVSAQNVAVSAHTTSVAPAAADQVSVLTAARFSTHAQLYQAISAQAAAIHQAFVTALAGSANSYEAAEAANAIAAGQTG